MKRNAEKYSLEIPSPCTENWEQMHVQEGGKFCSHCSKAVTDFTGMSDAAILQHLQNAKGKTCGRLNSGQLNRLLELPIRPAARPHMAAMVGGLLALAAANSVTGQNNRQPVTTTQQEENTNSKTTLPRRQPVQQTTACILGKIIDAGTKEIIPYATIQIKGTTTGIVTDEKGEFKLILPDSLAPKPVTLVIYGIGYEKMEVVVSAQTPPVQQEFFLRQEEAQLMGDIIIRHKPVKKKDKKK